MMQVMIGSVSAFTTKCVLGLEANREKAEGWLAKNAIIATALNPLIGYAASASLVRDAMQRNLTIQEVALEKVSAGGLNHVIDGHLLTEEEITLALNDLKHLTYGGIAGQ
jgi:fumarate hydratase, class II